MIFWQNGSPANFSKIWVPAEILLFVLVGAVVNVKYALAAGIMMVLMLLIGLIFRLAGTYLCVVGTKLNRKERIFCMISQIPKATVGGYRRRCTGQRAALRKYRADSCRSFYFNQCTAGVLELKSPIKNCFQKKNRKNLMKFIWSAWYNRNRLRTEVVNIWVSGLQNTDSKALVFDMALLDQTVKNNFMIRR